MRKYYWKDESILIKKRVSGRGKNRLKSWPVSWWKSIWLEKRRRSRENFYTITITNNQLKSYAITSNFKQTIVFSISEKDDMTSLIVLFERQIKLRIYHYIYLGNLFRSSLKLIFRQQMKEHLTWKRRAKGNFYTITVTNNQLKSYAIINNFKATIVFSISQKDDMASLIVLFERQIKFWIFQDIIG